MSKSSQEMKKNLCNKLQNTHGCKCGIDTRKPQYCELLDELIMIVCEDWV
jgi:hypothetical protein